MQNQKGGDVIELKLKLYLKTGKFKYDFTNITHNYAFMDSGLKGFNGGKFENEKPDRQSHSLSGQKTAWRDLKEDVVFMIRKMAKTLENEFLSTQNSKEFDF